MLANCPKAKAASVYGRCKGDDQDSSFALIAAALVATGSGLANCGGRRQQMKVCASQVAGKHLPKDQQHGEIGK